jgi:hypothetical protein
MIDWLKKLISADAAVSASRLLQTVIVIAIIPLLWMVVWNSKWVISDNARLVLICLIGGGAGGYITSKLKEGSGV